MADDFPQAALDRARRIRQFQAELTQLEQEGGITLTSEQQARLAAHLNRLLSGLPGRAGGDAPEAARRVSWGMKVAALLGGAALFAALVLFLHRIWGFLPLPAQVLLLAAVPLVLLAATGLASARRADRYYIGLLALATAAAFVAELNAVGMVLNLRASPHALLVWGWFFVLVAYACGVRLLLSAGLVLLGVYSAALILGAQGWHWDGFIQNSQYLMPAAVVIYSVPWFAPRLALDGFDRVYRLCGAGLGLLAILLLSTAGDLCCGGLTPDLVAGGYQTVGLLLSAGVVAHAVRLGWKGLLNLGSMAFLVFLFIRLHAWWWHLMPKYLFFFLIGLTAMGLLLLFRRLHARSAKGSSL
jgi:hypothetical protein